MRPFSVLLVVAALAAAVPASAQYRNNGIEMPSIGWLALGSSTDAINEALGITAWNTYDQPTLGVGYFGAIGYSLWTVNQVAVGASTDILHVGDGFTPVFSVAISTGLRYNLMDERHRPYLAGHIQYLQLVPAGPIPTPFPGNAVLGNAPFWVGLRLGGGYEYFFAEELAVQIDGGLIGLVGFSPGNVIRPTALARGSLNIYF